MKISCTQCGGISVYKADIHQFICCQCDTHTTSDELLNHYSLKTLGLEINRLRRELFENKDLENKNSVVCQLNTFQHLWNCAMKKMSENSSQVGYIKTGDVPYKVGLNNTKCEHPVAACRMKKCYLSAKDIKKKKCLIRQCPRLAIYNKKNNHIFNSGGRTDESSTCDYIY